MGADGSAITISSVRITNKKAQSFDWAFFALMSGLRQGAANGAECVADFGSQQTHNSNDNDGNESENNCILYEALTFFFRCK